MLQLGPRLGAIDAFDLHKSQLQAGTGAATDDGLRWLSTLVRMPVSSKVDMDSSIREEIGKSFG
jgi:hypothetical protein